MSGNSPNSAGTEAREVDWLLFNADWLVVCDSGMNRFRSGAVAIEADRIVSVGPSDELKRTFRGRREMNLGGHLLMPGLVNTHTHAAMSLFRGLADDLPLRNWLEDIIFPAEATWIDGDAVYLGTILSALEMLKGGTTTFCDGYFFEERAAEAALESGIRAVLGQGILDFPAPDQPDPARWRERTDSFLSFFPGKTDRIRPSLFCHAPYTCGPETMQNVKALCRENDILFQTHLSESSGEVGEILARYSKRPVIYLAELGILDELTLCAHGIWLSAEERAGLAAAKTSIAHCPESNMKLGSGVAPLTALFRSGVRVGLGTDGCASNNDLDLFTEMDKAAKLAKVFDNDPLACPAEQTLSMATLTGASTLGLAAEVGSIETGKKADLIALDLDQPHLTPLYDPVSHLVYSARGSDVRFVWVDGQLVVAKGSVLTIDEPGVLAEARRMAGRIARRIT